MTERDELVYLAQICEQIERYDEMVTAMKRVVQLNATLNADERALFSVGYKNTVGAKRAAWRIICSIEEKELSRGNTDNVNSTRGYRAKVEKELDDIIKEVLTQIEQHLLPAAVDAEGKAFFGKMQADYYRYHDLTCF